jgi:hypothetical protein
MSNTDMGEETTMKTLGRQYTILLEGPPNAGDLADRIRHYGITATVIRSTTTARYPCSSYAVIVAGEQDVYDLGYYLMSVYHQDSVYLYDGNKAVLLESTDNNLYRREG